MVHLSDINIIISLMRKIPAPANPWHDTYTFEWQMPSPPPHHNFPEPPVWEPVNRHHGDHGHETKPEPAE